jgi:hypothetical protein
MSTSELKTTAAPSSVPPVADVPHQTISTEPVVVGAGKIEEPAKALEGLAEPDILDKARDMVKPVSAAWEWCFGQAGEVAGPLGACRTKRRGLRGSWN